MELARSGAAHPTVKLVGTVFPDELVIGSRPAGADAPASRNDAVST
ncbi:hypothetical protein [Saccharomonospora glauca]|nr:hypothetical protein [Saccharomonospora glauca]